MAHSAARVKRLLGSGAIVGILAVVAAPPARAVTFQWSGAPESCPYTVTGTTLYSFDHRDPYFRWANDTPHSTGIRYILTSGVAASDYLDIAAHNTSYGQPANGYVSNGAAFWVRVYTPYGSCTNGKSSYVMSVKYGFVLG